MGQNKIARGADYRRKLNIGAQRRVIVVPRDHKSNNKTYYSNSINAADLFAKFNVPEQIKESKTDVKQTTAKNITKIQPKLEKKTAFIKNESAKQMVHFEDLTNQSINQKRIFAEKAKEQNSPVFAKQSSKQISNSINHATQTDVKSTTDNSLNAIKLHNSQININENKLAAPIISSNISPFDPLPVDLKDENKKAKKLPKIVKRKSQKGENLSEKTQTSKKQLRDKIKEKRAKKTEEKQARMENAVKLAALDDATTNFTNAEQILASSASMNSADSAVNSVSIDDSGAATLPRTDILTRIANMPKITFTFKINTKRLFAVSRALAVTLILAVSAYLAWDTWMTNRNVESTFSSPAGAMSIEGANPATADPTSISEQQWSAYTTPADQPRYIQIPSININARVMSVGVTSKGNIDTPKNLNDTAWYDGSAKPNQDGQVFIDGHTSFTNNLAAAFNDLPKLQNDAQITIELGNGEKINYKVVAKESIAADEVDMGKALNAPDGAKKGLTLMTCTGKFDYRTQNASDRYIVYAVQI